MRKFSLCACVFLSWPLVATFAEPARISHVRKEVKILQPSRAARPARLGDNIANGASLQTGAGSQAEMRFANGTLVRLAARTELRLENAPGRMQLLHGAILVRSPKGVGETRVAAGNVVAEGNGTTSLLEFYPQAYTKLIVLDGTARMFLPQVIGESVLVDAGQLLMFQARALQATLPNPVDLDLQRMMATSQLIQGFPPLESVRSIAQGMRAQKEKKSAGALADTNLIIFGRGTLVTLTAPSPSPTPAKAKSR